MIHITAQMRVLVAIEAVDGRKYAPSINMRSERWPVAKSGRSTGFERRITCATPWIESGLVTYLVAGIDRVVMSGETETPLPPAFR